jgi:type VI protein secretion system component Hcp
MVETTFMKVDGIEGDAREPRDYVGWFKVEKFAWVRAENIRFGEGNDVDAIVTIAGGKYASPFYRLRTDSETIDRIELHVIDRGNLEQSIELQEVVVTDYARAGETKLKTQLIELTLNATRAFIKGG